MPDAEDTQESIEAYRRKGYKIVYFTPGKVPIEKCLRAIILNHINLLDPDE